MSNPPPATKKQRAKEKMARIPIKIEPTTPETKLKLPPWIRVKAPTDNRVSELKTLLRDNKMVTVCEEASCPNLSECFSHGTATFMIMGDKCTRRCTFCDVGHGRPDALDPDEPKNLADTVERLNLRYVVITSVDRDDLRDGGAQHFVDCITQLRMRCRSDLKIEILVPDFRGRQEKALSILSTAPADVFNHNLETVPHLYKQVRPGSSYEASLELIQAHKQAHPHVPTKSGIMVGLGETDEQVIQTIADLKRYDCDMLTIGQYLQPSHYHHPVLRYVEPSVFEYYRVRAVEMGFTHVASGPMVRSSYHADLQAKGELVV